MEACDWFKTDENIGGTSAIFLLCLNPERIRLFNKTQGTHGFRARLNHGPLQVSNVGEANVPNAFRVLLHVLSASTLISGMAGTDSFLWAWAHFLLTASHLEHKLCVFYFLPKASPV